MDLDKKQDYGEEFDQEFENMEMSYTCLPVITFKNIYIIVVHSIIVRTIISD